MRTVCVLLLTMSALVLTGCPPKVNPATAHSIAHAQVEP